MANTLGITTPEQTFWKTNRLRFYTPHTHTLSSLLYALLCIQFSFSSSSFTLFFSVTLCEALRSWTFNPSLLPLLCRCFFFVSIRSAASFGDDDDDDAPSSSSCLDLKTCFKFCGWTTLNWNTFSKILLASLRFWKRKLKIWFVCYFYKKK